MRVRLPSRVCNNFRCQDAEFAVFRKGVRGANLSSPEAQRSQPQIARTIEVTMIKKVAGGYKVLSEKGRNLGGPYKSKAAAEKRLRQVEYFKHKG
jgi:hypothetical protein